MFTSMQLEPQSEIDFEANIERVAEGFKALSDSARLKIVRFLTDPAIKCCANEDGVCACDLEAITNLSQPTVSHHMKILANAGLVRSEKRGKWMYYTIEPSGFEIIKGFLKSIA